MRQSRTERTHRQRSSTEDTARQLQRVLDAAMAARKQVLRRYSNDTMIGALAGAAARWMDPTEERRRRAVEELAEALRVAPAMLRCGLDDIFSVITTDSLQRLVHDQAPTPSGLERAHALPSGARARLSGPAVVYHALAGNVPGLSIPAIVTSLLARSVAIIRDSSRQPLLTELFLETLAEDAPALSAMVVPVAWPSHRTDLEALAIAAASRVEAYGKDETLAEIHQRYPDRVVHDRGTRVSVGLVPSASDTDRWADGFAEDLCIYEGRGCLAPRAIYVVGPLEKSRRMAKRMAIALRRLDKLWPPRMQELEDEIARRAFLDRAEISAAEHPEDSVEIGREDAWCVHVTARPELRAAPGMRCVLVVPVPDERSVAESLEASHLPIAGVGLAMDPDQDGYYEQVALLRSAGATLVCAPGRLQAPPISWCPDGGKRLGDLLQWRAPDPP